MFRVLVTVALITSSVAAADADPKFAKLRDQAESLASLGGFIDKYLGGCGANPEGPGECQRNARSFRDSANGKKFYMIITEDSVSNLSVGSVDRDGITINLTPIFPGSDSAVTQGAPSRTDAAGNPVMPFIAIKAPVGELSTPQQLARQVGMKSLRLQVVFTPQGLWSLPKKGGGKIWGVKARLDTVLISVGRTGDQVALWMGKSP